MLDISISSGEFEQFTYSSLKSPIQRESMLENHISSLGTQSGNYGPFKEQARVINLKCAKSIMREIELLADNVGCDIKVILDDMPTLAMLIK